MVEFNTTEGQIGVLSRTRSPDGDREVLGIPSILRRSDGEKEAALHSGFARDPSGWSYHSGRESLSGLDEIDEEPCQGGKSNVLRQRLRSRANVDVARAEAALMRSYHKN